MNFPTGVAPQPGYVLVLLDGQEKDVLGIWGPYANQAEAEWARKELNLWPIDGVWDMVPLKYFPPPRTQTGSWHQHRNVTPLVQRQWRQDDQTWA